MVGAAAAVLVIGLPMIAVGGQLEARHRAAGAADAAALAAADAALGWLAGDPCDLAGEVAQSMAVELVSCEAVEEARVVVRVGSVLGPIEARAHAGSTTSADSAGGVVGANGWAWPSGVRAATQGHHEGFSIDLAVAADGALYAPYDGVVVRVGPAGGGIPPPCVANPSWWRGANHWVAIRHEYHGRVLYSSHNHIAPGSPGQHGIAPGTRVRAGQRVASVGMSGCTSGPHTHFTLATTLTNGFSDVDPYEYLGVP